jgi:hypothetical protein
MIFGSNAQLKRGAERSELLGPCYGRRNLPFTLPYSHVLCDLRLKRPEISGINYKIIPPHTIVRDAGELVVYLVFQIASESKG